MHYVYIIYSESKGVYYKGESEDILNRLNAHNNGLSDYTRGKAPWKLVFVEGQADRKNALKREKQIKKLNSRSILKLIASESNIAMKFN